MSTAEFFMNRALQLARNGLFSTDPNPRVGCLLVKNGDIVGEGWHEVAGQAHAEIHALRMAGDKARGADCYVTLEPCCHHGRTPPCSEALIAAGVKKVIAAMEDPNPQVAGEGLKQLQHAGIEVHAGVLQTEAEALNPGFVKRMRHGSPLLRCKLAMSLDGRTAMANNESQWITGAAARSDVQTLRARSSAIMTGSGTVLADDPSLSVRPEQFPAHIPPPAQLRHPLRVVVDSHLSISTTAKIFQLPGQVLLFTSSEDKDVIQNFESAGAGVFVLPNQQGHIDLKAMLQVLAQRECNEILLEAGSTLCGALLKAHLIDELVLYMAPCLMGDSAKGLFHLPWINHMTQRQHVEIHDIRAVGKDWRIQVKIT
jgi:diaminohydroxyphosphoribosylaminopyrimidine deaminase/5-amino-6-(5-phosphoribosylamino)uracil reductase